MDYEFRIKLLEKELAHAQEMQAILRERQDTADRRLDRLQGLTIDTAESLHSLTQVVERLALKVESLAGKVDTLVEALLRQHPDGGEPAG